MRFRGSWTIARLWGVPVRVHWSVIVFALLSGGFKFRPGAWVATLLLILIHEIGHALVVRRVGARATALDVLGFGGLCWWEGRVTPLQRAAIAWGGIWAQLVVFAIAALYVSLRGYPAHTFVADMLHVAVTNNLYLVAFNLLPIQPLDGAEAWSLVPLLWRRIKGEREPRVLLTTPRSVVTTAPRAPLVRPAPIRATARVQVIAPRLDRAHTERTVTAHLDDIDERDFTPEAHAVIERAREIAREAAREPNGPSSTSGSDPEADDGERPKPGGAPRK
ncbi:MAG: hypothetical protein U0441_34730 [Polyangiaceae bacterium]